MGHYANSQRRRSQRRNEYRRRIRAMSHGAERLAAFDAAKAAGKTRLESMFAARDIATLTADDELAVADLQSTMIAGIPVGELPASIRHDIEGQIEQAWDAFLRSAPLEVRTIAAIAPLETFSPDSLAGVDEKIVSAAHDWLEDHFPPDTLPRCVYLPVRSRRAWVRTTCRHALGININGLPLGTGVPCGWMPYSMRREVWATEAMIRAEHDAPMGCSPEEIGEIGQTAYEETLDENPE